MGAEARELICRFERDGAIHYGCMEGERIHTLAGDPFAGTARTGETVERSAVRLLAPVMPSKIIAVGLNYKSHVGERTPPSDPGLFAKFPNTVIGPGDPIPYPPDAEDLHAEGEMVVVIGKRARHLSHEEVDAHILGVTCGNDISERRWQASDLQWLRAKSCDGFAPLGPAIATGLDLGDLRLRTRVNGETVQDERTSMLIHSVADILVFATRYLTLEPGDVVFTGTPGTTRAIRPGDAVEIELEGVGVLANPVDMG